MQKGDSFTRVGHVGRERRSVYVCVGGGGEWWRKMGDKGEMNYLWRWSMYQLCRGTTPAGRKCWIYGIHICPNDTTLFLQLHIKNKSQKKKNIEIDSENTNAPDQIKIESVSTLLNMQSAYPLQAKVMWVIYYVMWMKINIFTFLIIDQHQFIGSKLFIVYVKTWASANKRN